MSYLAGSPVDRAIAAAYRDQRWTLRQCSYAFGPSVKTIRRILDRAGVARRSPRERSAGLASPAELASTLRYAQRGLARWTEYGLSGGCDDLSVAAEVFRQTLGWSDLSPWIGHHLGGLLPCILLPGRLFFWGITWLPVPCMPDEELYIVGPSAAGWWYARPRGNGTDPGWCAPTLAGLAARINSRPATRIVPSPRR